MKYMKMAAIALMALALFSCKNKSNEPSAEASALSLRINDSQLRAIEGEVAGGTETNITENVTIKLFPSGREINLTPTQIEEAKNLTKGTRITVGEVVKQVSIVKANAEITNDTEITAWQGKADKFTTEIPLTAPETTVTPGVEGKNTVYTVELQPVPAFSRVEVAGDIEAGNSGKFPENASGKSAYKSIKVEQVYINNYLPTRAGDRVYCAGKDGKFETDPHANMCDVIADQASFKAKSKVAGYQLFPIKKGEAAGDKFYDHIILRLTVEYNTDVAKGYPATAQTRYVTMVKFQDTDNSKITSFEAGKIYKLDLQELTKDFTTDDEGNPTGPDTPDPEQEGQHILVVKVKSWTWTAVNIKPDVNGGYKK
ncbi:hypothetical protein [Porphyromonas asaccharolytica]|uniref:Lipoprotein n=1 Tax=Porphyromonas asaccharolytica (strain ATCC 25260 / DSM 20707 / BCRC 10618 / CCUG 7834 / JCM 6326 / LMG 13178 / VPI 4198 / B440) TaxID=879243 RepID=F4KNK9_PORAD|nr:hypothetical protein [Porphyromonas asaccharolytica]AEE12480.1 hypothetical protein Poras_0527 [Porphyromonas asaccharolytica DSM 20707]